MNKIIVVELKKRLEEVKGAWTKLWAYRGGNEQAEAMNKIIVEHELPQVLWAYQCTPHKTIR